MFDNLENIQFSFKFSIKPNSIKYFLSYLFLHFLSSQTEPKGSFLPCCGSFYKQQQKERTASTRIRGECVFSKIFIFGEKSSCGRGKAHSFECDRVIILKHSPGNLKLIAFPYSQSNILIIGCCCCQFNCFVDVILAGWCLKFAGLIKRSYHL